MIDTITPEERASWRANCERKLPVDMARFGRPDPDDVRILRLLTALEAAEAQVVRLTAERDWLANRLACIQSTYDIDQKTKDWGTERWTEAARRAVEEGEVRG